MTPPVVMITGHGDVGMAVRCLKKGAYDFVEKPFEDDVLLASVTRAVERTRLRREGEEMRGRLQAMPQEGDGRFGMIGRSRTMQDIYESIQVAAGTDAPVLICGETGTGKELVARAIHAESRRAEGPFVPVNAGALPEATLESELFGHARGAFTGAEADRNGKLVTADPPAKLRKQPLLARKAQEKAAEALQGVESAKDALQAKVEQMSDALAKATADVYVTGEVASK